MKTTFDVIVAGAGIVGCACAEQCAAAGLSVLILDRDGCGGGTTAAGMGHVLLLDDSPAQLALTRAGRQLWRDRLDELPDDVEVDPCGTGWLALDADDMALATAKAQALQAAGLRAELLDGAAVRDAEPQVAAPVTGALLVPDDLVLYPPNAARFLLRQAQRHGAVARLHEDVVELSPDGRVALAGGDRLHAGCVVNAAGCEAARWCPDLPLTRRKGHLLVTARYPGWIRHQLVELGYHRSAHGDARASVAFNVQPRRTGQILIGSSRQLDAPTVDVQPDTVAAMLRRARTFLPRIGELQLWRSWVGWRPASPDHLPWIGPWHDSRLWLAAGHEGLGITTALVTGRLLADQLTGRRSDIDPAPYRPTPERLGGPTHD